MDNIFELLDQHPVLFVTLKGNFNACMSVNDSLERVKTKQESDLIELVRANNSTCNNGCL
jgi:hypothetical protein